MSEDAYTVNLEQLDAAVAVLQAFSRDVEAELADIDRRIGELHLSWSGDAATAQQQAHSRWMAGAAELRQNLDELREIARKAHTNYTAAIETNTRMWP
ncbi:WXG100 family type VII secretion target [Nocardia sp. CA-128927]|uniref:WXG100 family type VII secretion target n=1 Tax=Nocardia sp. CA-128927 TaxID=3239975 RepID=UPI003D951FF7